MLRTRTPLRSFRPENAAPVAKSKPDAEWLAVAFVATTGYTITREGAHWVLRNPEGGTVDRKHSLHAIKAVADLTACGANPGFRFTLCD